VLGDCSIACNKAKHAKPQAQAELGTVWPPWWVPEPPRATPPAMRGGAHTAAWGSTLGGHQWSPHSTPHIGNALLEWLNQPLGALSLMMLSPLPPTTLGL